MKTITATAYALMLFLFLAGLSFLVSPLMFFAVIVALVVLFAITKAKPGEDKTMLVATELVSWLKYILIFGMISIGLIAAGLYYLYLNP